MRQRLVVNITPQERVARVLLRLAGALGRCPLSARLGHVPPSLRRS